MCCEDKKQDKPQQNGLKTKQNQAGPKRDVKVVMLGDKAVGKSSIASRFCFNKVSGILYDFFFFFNSQFQTEYEITIGGVYNCIDMQVKGQQLKVHLWDTAGEEKFKSLLNLYYRDANAAIIVYDITQSETFDSVRNWLSELEDKIQKDKLLLALVGNKSDCLETDRKVPKQKASDFAKQNNMIFYETSAKTGEGVNQLFQQLIEDYASRM